MAFSITNKGLTLPSEFDTVLLSTAQMQFVTTATSTSGGMSHQEFADYTTTGAIPLSTQMVAGGIGDFGAAYRTWRALVSFKAPMVETTTSTGSVLGPLVALEVATSTAAFVGSGSTGSTKGALIVATQMVFATVATSTGNAQSLFLFGMTPTVAGAQFARINFYPAGAATFMGSSSTGVDAIIEAA